ncbi:MAG: glycosyltransferase family 4 protein, partial [Solirubrobacteraceae bacterium]
MQIGVIEPFPYGGLLHYSTQLADALAERGNTVELVVSSDNELRAHEGAARRRPILPPNASPAPPHPTRRQRALRRARTASRLSQTWLRILKYARAYRGDVILLGGGFDMAPNALAGLVVTLASRRTPIVHICHNVRPYDRWAPGELYVRSRTTTALLRALYSHFDLVLVHGERSRAEFEANWPHRRLAIIPHGNEQLFSNEPPPLAVEPRVLFFGTWSKVKGLPLLMEAFDILRQELPEARLTIAGAPAYEEGEAERVMNWARERGNAVEVMPRYIPIPETHAIFARARVVAIPYYTAYQSGIAHLAMTMARPAVATDVGDLPEAVLDGVTGLIVPPRDARRFAKALRDVLDEPALAARLGEAALARAREELSWARVAERLEKELAV